MTTPPTQATQDSVQLPPLRDLCAGLDALHVQIGLLEDDNTALRAQVERLEAAGGQVSLEEVYKRGWIACAGFANRQDLVADIDSPAYLNERAGRLALGIHEPTEPDLSDAQVPDAVEHYGTVEELPTPVVVDERKAFEADVLAVYGERPERDVHGYKGYCDNLRFKFWQHTRAALQSARSDPSADCGGSPCARGGACKAPNCIGGAALASQPPAERVPLTDEQIWNSDDIMSRNAVGGLQMPDLVRLIRAVEAAHGIQANGRTET